MRRGTGKDKQMKDGELSFPENDKGDFQVKERRQIFIKGAVSRKVTGEVWQQSLDSRP